MFHILLDPDANLAADPFREYTYRYDRAGNRLSESIALDGGMPSVTNFTYDAANRLTSGVVVYDDAGRMTRDGRSYSLPTHSWDGADRLREVFTYPYTYDIYTYDGLGNRVRYVHDIHDEGTYTSYLLDLQSSLAKVIVEKVDGGHAVYTHDPLGVHRAGNYWTLTDGLGSVRGQVDANLAISWNASYAPCGERINGPTSGFGIAFNIKYLTIKIGNDNATFFCKKEGVSLCRKSSLESR